MKVVVIDDFRLARLELISLFHDHKDIDLVGEAENGDEALDLIHREKPDVIFTDINMPGMSVFDFLEEIDESTYVVFTTAYSDYAVKTFGFNTIDYLLKPISKERFSEALLKIRKRRSHESNVSKIQRLDKNSKIMVKVDKDFVLKNVDEIIRVESSGSESRIIFNDVSSTIFRSLNKLEERLPLNLFFRVSRQALVNIHFVKSIVENRDASGHQLELIDGSFLPITRRQLAIIRDSLVL